MTESTRARLVGLARVHEEKLRFLVVGFGNTVIGYGLFAIMLFLWGTERYSIALVSGWVISVCVSYTTMKTFVFRTRGTNWVAELARSYVVYVGALLVNLAVLNAFVRLAHMHPLVGQFASIFIVTIISFVGHKYFTFGNKHAIEAIDTADIFEEPHAANAPDEGDPAE